MQVPLGQVVVIRGLCRLDLCRSTFFDLLGRCLVRAGHFSDTLWPNDLWSSLAKAKIYFFMIGFRRKTVNSVLRLFTFTDSVNVDFEDQVLSFRFFTLVL